LLDDFNILGRYSIGKRALWYVDLALTVRQVDVNSVVSGLAVRGWIENVADYSAVCERAVRDLALLSGSVVGQSNQEFASGESKEAIVDIAFNVSMVPDLACLALSIDLLNNLVQVRVSIVRLPE
jgi:hypothetical protein